jgi:pilin isopeptide linkage protein
LVDFPKNAKVGRRSFTIMDFTKIKKSVTSLVMTLLLVTGMLPIQAFATDQSAQDTNVGSVDFEVELQIQGDTPLEDAAFTFELEAEDDAPVPSNTYVTRTGAGNVNFGDIEFTHTGEYHYKISEQNDGIENYTYDDTVYRVDVAVTYDSDGNMVANIVAYDDASEGDTKEPEIVFVNGYTDTTRFDSDEPTTVSKDSKTTTNVGDKSSTPTTDKKGNSSQTGQSPDTGDYSNMRQWIEIVCVAIVGLVSCLCYLNGIKKRTKNDDEI